MSILLTIAAILALANSSPCRDIAPIQLPVTDIQVLPDVPDSFMRGIAAKLGTPSQDIVMLPWP